MRSTPLLARASPQSPGVPEETHASRATLAAEPPVSSHCCCLDWHEDQLSACAVPEGPATPWNVLMGASPGLSPSEPPAARPLGVLGQMLLALPSPHRLPTVPPPRAGLHVHCSSHRLLVTSSDPAAHCQTPQVHGNWTCTEHEASSREPARPPRTGTEPGPEGFCGCQWGRRPWGGLDDAPVHLVQPQLLLKPPCAPSQGSQPIVNSIKKEFFMIWGRNTYNVKKRKLKNINQIAFGS